MSIWGATVKSGVTTLFSAEEGVLELTHVTLVGGKHARIKFRLVDSDKPDYFILAHLNAATPSLRTQVVLEEDAEFLVEGDAAACVSIVGNIRLDSFPDSDSENSLYSEDETLASSSDLDEASDESGEESDDENDDWDMAEKLKALLNMAKGGKHVQVSSAMSDRVVDVTNDTTAVPSKKKALALPSAVAEKPAFGNQVTAAVNKASNKRSAQPSEKEKKEDQKEVVSKKARAQPVELKEVTTELPKSSPKKPATVVPSAKQNTTTKTTLQVPAESINGTLPGGVKYSILAVGSGKTAAVGKRVKVKYEGRLASNGKKI